MVIRRLVKHVMVMVKYTETLVMVMGTKPVTNVRVEVVKKVVIS